MVRQGPLGRGERLVILIHIFYLKVKKSQNSSKGISFRPLSSNQNVICRNDVLKHCFILYLLKYCKKLNFNCNIC